MGEDRCQRRELGLHSAFNISNVHLPRGILPRLDPSLFILFPGPRYSLQSSLILNGCTFQEDTDLWTLFAYCKAGCTPCSLQGRRGAETPVNKRGFQPPPSLPPHHSREHLASASHRPPGLPLGTRGLDLARHRLLPTGCREGAASSLDCISAALLPKRKYKYCKDKGARGPWPVCAPWSQDGPDPESTGPSGWLEALGSSLQTTFCQPCLLPHGCAPLGAQAAPARDSPTPVTL